jgi:hypothetical protein
MGVLKWTRRFCYGDALARCVSTNEVVYTQTMKKEPRARPKTCKSAHICCKILSASFPLCLVHGMEFFKFNIKCYSFSLKLGTFFFWMLFMFHRMRWVLETVSKMKKRPPSNWKHHIYFLELKNKKMS